jgi:hypothetical protein
MFSHDGLDGFAERLNQLCDEKRIPYRGRAELMSKKFDVTREAARKWLKGLAYPTLSKRTEIVQWAGVTDHWLMTGKGERTPPLSTMTGEQRQALQFMQQMDLDQQRLALRLVAQVMGESLPADGASIGVPLRPTTPPPSRH